MAVIHYDGYIYLSQSLSEMQQKQVLVWRNQNRYDFH